MTIVERLVLVAACTSEDVRPRGYPIGFARRRAPSSIADQQYVAAVWKGEYDVREFFRNLELSFATSGAGQ